MIVEQLREMSEKDKRMIDDHRFPSHIKVVSPKLYWGDLPDGKSVIVVRCINVFTNAECIIPLSMFRTRHRSKKIGNVTYEQTVKGVFDKNETLQEVENYFVRNLDRTFKLSDCTITMPVAERFWDVEISYHAYI